MWGVELCVSREGAEGRDGLCLWCRLGKQGLCSAGHGDSVGLCSLSSVRPWTVTVHSDGFIAPLRIMVHGFMLNHGATSADS